MDRTKFKKLTKAQRLKEAKRIIDEAVAFKNEDIDLSGLGLNDEDMKTLIIPERFSDSEKADDVTPEISMNLRDYLIENEKEQKIFKHSWYLINLSHNNLTKIENLPSVVTLNLSNNPKLTKLTLKSKVYTINVNNTSLDSLEDNYEFIEGTFHFLNTPLEKKVIVHREVDKERVKERSSSGSKEQSSKVFKYTTYIIPKGTVLFHSFGDKSDMASVYVGYRPNKFYYDRTLKKRVEDPDIDKYFLLPDQLTFFYTSPQVLVDDYRFGKVRTFFVLQNDIEVILGFKPSIRVKETAVLSHFGDINETLFYGKCSDSEHKIKRNDVFPYNCLKPEFKEKNIAGFFTNWWNTSNSSYEVDADHMKNLMYLPEYETFHKHFYIPEVAIYPKAKRETKDIITPISEFNEEWLHNHLPEFNYKPLYIFDEDVTPETYKETFLQLLSPEGLVDSNDPSLVQHFTINKTDGTYVLAELASAETLRNCLDISEDKTLYLKNYLDSSIFKF